MYEESGWQEPELSGQELMELTTKVETPQALLESFKAQVPPPAELREEAKEFLARIKESKIAGNLARAEREKRRRRFLVSLQDKHKRIEQKHLKEHLVYHLSRPCLEEQRINYLVWKAATTEPLMVAKRAMRTTYYDEQKKVDRQAAQERDLKLRDHLVSDLHCVTQVKDANHYKALERGRVARRKGALSMSIEKMVVNDLTSPFTSSRPSERPLVCERARV